jgi:addiction module HigA family antidote
MIKDRIAQLKERTARPMTPGQALGAMLEEWELSQREIARRMGVSAATVSEFIRDERRLTPDMAQRLGRLSGVGAGIWLGMQQTVDMWDLLQMDEKAYQGIEKVEVAA